MSDRLLVILDDARAQRCQVFRSPSEVLEATSPTQVATVLRRMQEALDRGHHLAGYFSYELGYVLEDRLSPLLPPNRPVPLLSFGVFDRPPECLQDDAAAGSTGRAYAGPLSFEWDENSYRQRFARVAEWIGAGDIYQANLSMRARFRSVGAPRALYRDIRHHAGASYGAFIDAGETQILSFSPELFFELSAGGAMVARPMKGTAARGETPEQDLEARDRLSASAKNRAENLMIVDLIRNDIGRIAEAGSVAATDLFGIETYPTVHQMTSTVRAKLRPDIGIAKILHAIFPAGSITGAPKIRAMEIIREVEQSPRGIYCGAIGCFAQARPEASQGALPHRRELNRMRKKYGRLQQGAALHPEGDSRPLHPFTMIRGLQRATALCWGLGQSPNLGRKLFPHPVKAGSDAKVGDSQGGCRHHRSLYPAPRLNGRT